MVLLRILLAGFALLPLLASAQQPVRILIAGGIGEDTTARAIARRLQGQIKQDRAVDLLLVTQDAFASDTLRDATPVSLIGSVPLLIATNPAAPGFSLKDRITLARSSPNPLAYASPAKTGTTPHVAAELLGALAGLKVEQIPYKLESPTLLFVHLPDALQPIRDGRLRPLAVTSRQRSALVSDTPTVAESGVPGYEIATWFGLVLPAGSRETAASLHLQIVKIFGQREARDELVAAGMTLEPSTPEHFAEVRRADHARWEKLLRR